jgi:hypothetical protein
MKDQVPRVRAWALVSAAVVFCGSGQAHAKSLVRVQIPPEDFHDPLYIDGDSIQRSGDLVRFSYVLDVPILGKVGADPAFRSNEVEAVIDCAAKTISLGDAITYSGRAATGDMIFGQVATSADKQPRRVDLRRYSTFGYLFRHVCGR